MKVRNQAVISAVVVLTSFACCAVSHAAEYKETDLPFKVADLVIKKGGGYSEKIENGSVKPSCSGISLKGLSLGDREIPLKSTSVTSDCLIETKEYGNLRMKINFATYSYGVLVTPKQGELFKKLTHR